MIATYLLLLILQFGPGEPDQAWVVDYDLAREDCLARMAAFVALTKPRSGISYECTIDDGGDE